ncbi:MAG TPA: hypothetical protein VFS24_15580 [Steroidobacteraceae bacterium]|nr:hypothetical protein [Steroidobacteraceae bacterium]
MASANSETSTGDAGAVPYRVVEGVAQTDRETVLALWRDGGLGQQVLGANHAHDAARFEWYYLQNPQGIARVYLLKHAGSDRPIGTMGIGPRMFWVAGAELVGGTLVDFVTHPKHRSAFPALMLQRQSRALGLASMQVVYGLPDAKAAAICRRLQSQVQFEVPRWVHVVHAAPYLARLVPSGIASVIGACLGLAHAATLAVRLAGCGVVGEWLSHFDDRFDALWSSVDKRTRIIGQRDSAFLRWRFGQQPGRQHRIFVSRPRGARDIRTYFICEIEAGVLVVKDCLSQGSPQQIAIDLLLLCRAARALPVKSLELLLQADESWNRALASAAFKRRSHRPFFATLAPDHQIPGELQWYVTQADEDV